MTHQLTAFTKRTVLHCLLLTILLNSCTNNKQELEKPLHPKLTPIAWLKGDWENRIKTDALLESWTIGNDSLLYGQGYEIINNDTLFQEKLAILVNEDSISYVATVPNQNDGQPVWFRITEMSDSGFVCENLTHDFPKIIRYSLEGNSVLAIKLEGIVDSLPKSQELILRRAKVRLMP
ncbi:MAG TPA: DUF6265 family protein [Bacteroidia bacterium]|nr:DUF6265 family protein [Bacteroidia bacterium]HNP98543.1 DUF6265 family protein [Bacteroidia bacterium]